MTTSSLLSNELGLWFLAITSTLASVLTFRAAYWFGSIHRFGQIMLAVATSALAVSYWWALMEGPNLAQQELRRGAAFIGFPALAWSVWAGTKFAADRELRARAVLDRLRVRAEEEADGGDRE